MAQRQHPIAQEIAGQPEADYNYSNLSLKVFLKDAQLTMAGGPYPGDLAPDFELTTTDDKRVRLSDLRGQLVVLIFGSVT